MGHVKKCIQKDCSKGTQKLTALVDRNEEPIGKWWRCDSCLFEEKQEHVKKYKVTLTFEIEDTEGEVEKLDVKETEDTLTVDFEDEVVKNVKCKLELINE